MKCDLCGQAPLGVTMYGNVAGCYGCVRSAVSTYAGRVALDPAGGVRPDLRDVAESVVTLTPAMRFAVIAQRHGIARSAYALNDSPGRLNA